MRLSVQNTRHKKRSISDKVQKLLSNIRNKVYQLTIVKSEISKIKINEKNLENEKYDGIGMQLKINIDNVVLNKQHINKHIYTHKQEKGTQQASNYNYYSPLDDSPKKTTKNKKNCDRKMIDTNEDLHTMSMLNSYVTDMPTTYSTGTGWETVGEKQKEKQKNAVHEETSLRYLPRYLLPGCRSDKPVVKTTKIIPLIIKLRPPEDNKQHPHKTRIVAAVLRALQTIYSDTYLATVHEDHNIKDLISNPDSIPIEEHKLENYLIMGGDGRQFVGKIYIHTNAELIKYKQSPHIRLYLAKENLMIDENALMSIRPPNVGFLEATIPRNETLDLHTQRLKKKLPTDVPKFQLCISSLYVRTGLRCRVIVMRADPENVERLQEEMNKLNETKSVAFFHWGEYLSLTTEQREDIINHQNKWNANIRSLLLSGFTNNADEHPMKSEDESVMNTNTTITDYLYETNVTDYFRKHVAAGNGTRLFAYVYPPVKGTYEFLVKVQHESEAKDYLKKAMGELTKRMTTDVIEKTFRDIDAATESIHSPPWRPYSRSLMILPERMPTGEGINDKSNSKRSRGEESYISGTHT
jgi:hypothetical protein